MDYPEPETVILLGRNGFRIVEVCALMRERQGGGSSIDEIRGVYYMIKVLLAILITALRKPVVTSAGMNMIECKWVEEERGPV